MKKRRLIYLLAMIFLVNIMYVQAVPQNKINEPLPHKQNTELTFSFSDTLAIGCNVSSMDTPNNTVWINQAMAKTGNTFSATILKGNFTTLGIYCINIECQQGSGSVCREITKTGTILETGESITYFILALGVLILFILSFYFMISTPYGNETNENGAVMKISKLKYIKLGLILLTWVLFTWFLNILIGLSDNFVTITMFYGFFGFIFEIMNTLALPLGIFILVLSGYEIVKDTNIHKEISKFGNSQ